MAVSFHLKRKECIIPNESYNPVANKRKKVVKNVLFQIFAVIVGIVIISPIIYAFFISIMPSNQILSNPPKLIPRSVTLDHL